jgi:hypothetical protein
MALDAAEVTVGTRSISPLLWAIENASLTAADAILQAQTVDEPSFAQQ